MAVAPLICEERCPLFADQASRHSESNFTRPLRRPSGTPTVARPGSLPEAGNGSDCGLSPPRDSHRCTAAVHPGARHQRGGRNLGKFPSRRAFACALLDAGRLPDAGERNCLSFRLVPPPLRCCRAHRDLWRVHRGAERSLPGLGNVAYPPSSSPTDGNALTRHQDLVHSRQATELPGDKHHSERGNREDHLGPLGVDRGFCESLGSPLTPPLGGVWIRRDLRN